MQIEVGKDADLRGIMVRNRVELNRRAREIPWREASAIVSRVPEVQLEFAEWGWSTRGRKLTLRDGQRKVDFHGHLMPSPEGGYDDARVAVTGLDSTGRRVPLVLSDPVSRTIRLLVDPRRIRVTPDVSPDPVMFMNDLLIGAPLEALMKTDGEPIMGSEFPEALQSLFAYPVRQRERVILNRERSYLERLREGTIRFPEMMTRRLRAITRRLDHLEAGDQPPAPLQRQELSGQADRLARLVRSRACAALWVCRGEMGGRFNPAPEGGPKGRGPLEFRIKVDPEAYPGWVFIWPPDRKRENPAPSCLGSGFNMLQELEAQRDAFAMVDLVINYVEMNDIGWPRTRRARPGDLAFETLGFLEEP